MTDSQEQTPASGSSPPAVPEARPGDRFGPGEQVALGLSRSDRRLLWGLSGVVLFLGGIHLARLHGQGGLINIDRPPERKLEYTLEINTATWVEWMQLDEIGETLARSIVADRAARGPFQSIEDVRRVRGIGPKTMEVIRPHLKCRECPEPSAAESPAKTRP